MGITPLATIPYLETRARRVARRSVRIAVVVAAIIGIPAGIWALDAYYMPIDLIVEKVMERLTII